MRQNTYVSGKGLLWFVQEGQRDPPVELPAGAAEGPQDETGAVPAATEGVQGDGVHPGLDGGNQGRRKHN
ncbi:hypothetical protein DPMN_099623 [Dreissena polymorpha]|uniref:Uncharacterized protein n=1 Tax=Dreissena polymorpha TaxID=45954 RepID=A0A9D4R6L9_DREPO|nr:hypothetical protein DPMN_099623 [Dreissena polymorpha]